MGEFEVTKEMLLATKAGLVVNKLRKHSNVAVKNAAKDLRATWQTAVGISPKAKSASIKVDVKPPAKKSPAPTRSSPMAGATVRERVQSALQQRLTKVAEAEGKPTSSMRQLAIDIEAAIYALKNSDKVRNL